MCANALIVPMTLPDRRSTAQGHDTFHEEVRPSEGPSTEIREASPGHRETGVQVRMPRTPDPRASGVLPTLRTGAVWFELHASLSRQSMNLRELADALKDDTCAQEIAAFVLRFCDGLADARDALVELFEGTREDGDRVPEAVSGLAESVYAWLSHLTEEVQQLANLQEESPGAWGWSEHSMAEYARLYLFAFLGPRLDELVREATQREGTATERRRVLGCTTSLRASLERLVAGLARSDSGSRSAVAATNAPPPRRAGDEGI